MNASEDRQYCPHCKGTRNRISETRPAWDYVRRRRRCIDCGGTWLTFEVSVENLDREFRKGLPHKGVAPPPTPGEVANNKREKFMKAVDTAIQQLNELKEAVR